MAFEWKRDDLLPRIAAPSPSSIEHFAHGAAPAAVADAAPFAYPGPADPTALMPWIDDVAALGTSGNTHDEIAHPVSPRPPVEKRVSERQPPRPRRLKNDQNWTSLTPGSMPERWAPSTVQLPPDIVRGLDAAQKRSAADGLEHGGNIVRDGESYSARYTGAGSKNAFEHDPDDLGPRDTFVGSYHTHPDSSAIGDQNTTFSEHDLANLVGDSRRVSLLRSSKDTHMLAKTKEFDAMVENSDDHDALGLQITTEYNAVYKKVLGNDPTKHAAAMDAATQATAKQFHLLYYSGRGANLKRAGGPKR